MRKLILASSVMAILCTDAAVNATANNFTAVKTPLMHQSVDNRVVNQANVSNVPEMVRKAAIKEGVPVRFALAVAEHESHFRCNAVGSSGERGVMQIKPSTARGIGYKGTSRGLNNCQIGIYWGIKYLKMAIDEANGDLKKAAFLYNAGINAKSRNPHKKKYVQAVFSRKSLTE